MLINNNVRSFNVECSYEEWRALRQEANSRSRCANQENRPDDTDPHHYLWRLQIATVDVSDIEIKRHFKRENLVARASRSHEFVAVERLG